MHSQTNFAAQSGGTHDPSLPQYYPFSSATASSTPQTPSMPSGTLRIFYGWRHALCSWFNLLLLFLPASWVVTLTLANSNGLKFAFCSLALIPLVRLHDITIRELSNRIGGSRTGLLNGSLSNLVAVVVAISALQRCELRVVQSMLIGCILAKLLLVLGLCFFAGGVNFAEQGFDATTTQVSSSLLSLSVGAVILPVAYHFVLSNEADSSQEANILRMSHGVSIVLILIYLAYLVFQLWSHSHLFHDGHNKKSNRLSSTIMREKQMRKRARTQSHSLHHLQEFDRKFVMDPLNPPQPPYMMSQSSSASELTLGRRSLMGSMEQLPIDTWGGSTVRLVQPDNTASMNLKPSESSASGFSSGGSTAFPTPQTDFHLPATLPVPITRVRDPKMSWFLTMLLLVLVTGAVAVEVELLVEAMDEVSHVISKEWVGLILLPAISSIAEGMSAIRVSVKDELTLSVAVAVGSTIQLALFVMPFMVLLAWVTHKPLSLLIDPFQSMVLYIAVATMGYVVQDGKSNWLEGIILICLYVIIAVSFWFYPGATLPVALSTCKT